MGKISLRPCAYHSADAAAAASASPPPRLHAALPPRRSSHAASAMHRAGNAAAAAPHPLLIRAATAPASSPTATVASQIRRPPTSMVMAKMPRVMPPLLLTGGGPCVVSACRRACTVLDAALTGPQAQEQRHHATTALATVHYSSLLPLAIDGDSVIPQILWKWKKPICCCHFHMQNGYMSAIASIKPLPTIGFTAQLPNSQIYSRPLSIAGQMQILTASKGQQQH